MGLRGKRASNLGGRGARQVDTNRLSTSRALTHLGNTLVTVETLSPGCAPFCLQPTNSATTRPKRSLDRIDTRLRTGMASLLACCGTPCRPRATHRQPTPHQPPSPVRARPKAHPCSVAPLCTWPQVSNEAFQGRKLSQFRSKQTKPSQVCLLGPSLCGSLGGRLGSALVVAWRPYRDHTRPLITSRVARLAARTVRATKRS